MTVKFKDPLSAQACVIVSAAFCLSAERTSPSLLARQKMNGRFFAGRRIEASLYAGRQRFKRTGFSDTFGGGEQDEKNRLDEFAQWLMAEGE